MSLFMKVIHTEIVHLLHPLELDKVQRQFLEKARQRSFEQYIRQKNKINSLCVQQLTRRSKKRVHVTVLANKSFIYENNNLDAPSPSFHPRLANLCGVEFTDRENKLLHHGLNYAPSTQINSARLLELTTHLDAALEDQDRLSKFECAKIIEQNKNKINKNISITKSVGSIRRKLENNNLILCKADKGNTITILHKNIYLEKMQDCLSNMKLKEISSDPTIKFNKAIHTAVSNSCSVLDRKQKFLMINSHPSAPILYGLPKLHKSGVPVRPVSSSYNAPAQNLSKFLSRSLPALINFNPMFSIKNSFELIEKTKHLNIPINAKLISFDVCNLFPSIPLVKLKSILYDRIRLEILDTEKMTEIIKLTDLCIDQNYFQFNNKFYIQEDGLAMGSALSPFLAEFFMSYLENELLNSGLPVIKNILFWTRYVDDILCIWTGTERQLKNFVITVLNKLDENIKFTVEIGNKEINFLDLTLSIENNKFKYNIFRKSTFSDAVIPKNSCHPWNIKMAAFHCMIERLLKVPLSIDDFNKELITILTIAKNNGYKQCTIIDIIKKKNLKQVIDSIYPESNRRSQDTLNYKKIPYVEGLSNKLKNCLKKTNITPAFFNRRNLKNLLVNNKINTKIDDVEKSGVYKLNCNDCEAVYIGKTKRSLKTRFSEHIYASKNNRPSSGFAKHLRDYKHSSNLENMKLVHSLKGGKVLDRYEIFEIRREQKDGTFLVNDQIDFSNRSPLLDPAIVRVS